MSMEHAQKATVAKILQYVNLRDKEVLEIGCGDGRLTALFAELTPSLVAIDPDTERLNQAKTRVPGVEFEVGSGEHLECADASFDVIIFTLSLHHQNSAVALQESYRVLRPDGRVIVAEPSGEGQIEQLCRLFHDEAREQENAQRAIAASAFTVECHEQFDTDWRFEDRHAVYAGFSQHYETRLDESLIARIDAIVGEHIDARPLILKDTLQLTCLRK